MSTQNHLGFTLIELLLAISISALLGGMAYSGLDVVVTARERNQKADHRNNEIYLGMLTLARDIRHAYPRPIRDENSNYRHAFESEGEPYQLFSFTRSGHHNPGNIHARSTLQRVRYRFDGDRLLRDAWLGLDRAADNYRTTTVLSGVESISLRFLRQVASSDDYTDTEWIDHWIDQSLDPWQNMPIAIEIKLEFSDWGSVRRIFESRPMVLPPPNFKNMESQRRSYLNKIQTPS